MPYQYAPPLPQSPPRTPVATGQPRECDMCHDMIAPGDPAVEIFLGVLGTSKKSGQPIVVLDPAYEGTSLPTTGIIHVECTIDYINEYIFEDDAEDPRLCWHCEREIDGDGY